MTACGREKVYSTKYNVGLRSFIPEFVVDGAVDRCNMKQFEKHAHTNTQAIHFVKIYVQITTERFMNNDLSISLKLIY